MIGSVIVGGGIDATAADLDELNLVSREKIHLGAIPARRDVGREVMIRLSPVPAPGDIVDETAGPSSTPPWPAGLAAVPPAG